MGSDSDFFATMAVDAMLAVKTVNNKGEVKYPVKAVNILKSHGKSATESVLVHGYAINCTVASQGLSFPCLLGKLTCRNENPHQKCKDRLSRHKLPKNSYGLRSPHRDL